MSAAIVPIATHAPATSGQPVDSIATLGPPPRIAFRKFMCPGEALRSRSEPQGALPNTSCRAGAARGAPMIAPHTAFKSGASLPQLGQRLHGASAPPPHRGQDQDGASAASPQRGHDLDDDDPLEPLHRHRAALAPPDMLLAASAVGAPSAFAATPPAQTSASTARAAASLEDLVPALVRRIAWSGDRHRGTVRLELGAGELAGATLLVQAEGGRVSVHMEVPPGVDAGRWRERIRQRLSSRGVPTDAVEVT
jgi:hypothetical protein